MAEAGQWSELLADTNFVFCRMNAKNRDVEVNDGPREGFSDHGNMERIKLVRRSPQDREEFFSNRRSRLGKLLQMDSPQTAKKEDLISELKNLIKEDRAHRERGLRQST